MASPATMAMSSDFFSAFARLPSRQQRRVSQLISKFERNPTSPGLNYERVRRAQSPNVRSLRVDKGYRAIVHQAPRGAGHLLLWVDKHDKAYEWAARHRCDINPETGAIQIYVPTPVSEPMVSQRPYRPKGPFADLRHRELVRLGVPEAMVNEVHSVQGDGLDAIDRMESRLPDEAYEGLFYYLTGDSYETIIRKREVSLEPVDPDDFTAALMRRESQSRFVVVTDQNQLEAMLNAPLEKWRVFLHPEQRTLVNRNWNGPVRVLGAAGTGKTVVAMHRAKWLASSEQDFRKILFITFNRNLATDIEQNLRQICSAEEMDRIEVRNLDAWVYGFLRRNSYRFEIRYGRDNDEWRAALNLRPNDLGLPKAFYEAEWKHVVQANGVQSLSQYKRVSRIGRGTPLTRSARTKVWPVFEEYRQRLEVKNCREMEDAFGDAVEMFRSGELRPPYSSVVVDEAQDLSTQGFRLIRCLAPEGRNDLFIAGDCHQRIYGRKTVLGRCGINIRGRSRKLRLNYRTTEQTRAWAARLLEGRHIDDLDGGIDDNRHIRSLTEGPKPLVRNFDTPDEQWSAVVEYLSRVQQQGSDLKDVCVVARTLAARDQAKEAIVAGGISVVLIENKGDDRKARGVRVATMHRVKGLEFERVVLVSMNRNLVPPTRAMREAADEAEVEDTETRERALVYVAASRAKKELLVLSYKEPSAFLEASC